MQSKRERAAAQGRSRRRHLTQVRIYPKGGGGTETPKTEDEATKAESGTSLTGGGDSKAGSDTSNTSGKAPGTGDDSRAALWGMLALFAGICSAEIVLVRRKKIK